VKNGPKPAARAAAKKPAKPGKRKPGVELGDEVYFKAGDQHTHGRVVSHGAHGCHVDHEGGRARVYWDDVLGHKSRSAKSARVLNTGDDGFLMEDDHGRRRFVAGEVPEVPPEKREANDDDHAALLKEIHRNTPMMKSLQPAVPVLFFKGGPVANRPGLTKKVLTDKTGRQTTRWVRTNPDRPSNDNGPAKDPDPTDKRGSKAGYGTHDIQPGSRVKFKAGEHAGEGEVTAVGEHGLTAKDATGREHQVHHHEVTHFKPGEGVKQPEVKNTVLGEQKPIPAESFTAADYAKSHDQADVTAESVLANFPEDTTARIEAAQKRLEGIEQTIEQFKKDGAWDAKRQILHHTIVSKILTPDRIRAAMPAPGEKPKFIILGGRGGSGKSSFEGMVYDPDKAIVLDADHIKSMIPEYEGWNAHQVHEESGELFDHITDLAQQLGLNICHDATMKTPKKAVALVQRFNDAGYDTEAHYMHLPRQEAAKRAVGRFLGGGEKGRYVPVDVVLSNTSNEASFDSVKGLVKSWSFRDNNVAKGEKPILISQSGDAKAEPQADAPELKKSAGSDRMIMLFRRM
jgi:predicted ABC-type ATPase